MGLKSKVHYLLNGAKNYLHIYNTLESEQFFNDRLYGELIRNVHSIEKGLSLAETRFGFGFKKILEAMDIAETLDRVGLEKYSEALNMFADAVKMYLEFHKYHNYSDDNIVEIQQKYDCILKKHESISGCIGGMSIIKRHIYSPDEKSVINALIENRHSVREFSGESVDSELLIKAIKLAHHCPSACNRQAYRVHVIDKDQFGIFENWFEGMGGFVDQIDKFILITGKHSLYRKEEELQYIVSASVYAGYLTLALEVEGIGCCFVQRPVVYNTIWSAISKRLNIPEDEQVVCSLGIGSLKEEYKAPISHRIQLTDIVTFHN